ncbi:MAG: ABC transporter permease [Chitinophagaceae bacterium]
MIRNYFKTAFRNLTRNKIYSFINIAGLSLGLAAAMLIMLFVKDEVSYDRFHKNLNQTYLVARKITSNSDGSIVGTDGYTGYLQGPSFKDAIPGVDGFVRMLFRQVNYKKNTDVESQLVYYVDANFFSAFSFPLISGNAKTVLQDPHSVVISENMAKKLFGKTDAAGQTLQIKGDDGEFSPHLVSGVAKNCPENSSIKFEMLLPLTEPVDAHGKDAWLNSLLNTFVILKPNTDVKSVESSMRKISEANNALYARLHDGENQPKSTSIFLLQPFEKLHLSQDYRAYELSDASSPTFSYMLSGIAIFILLIACINFINLTIARSVKRAKEIGIRKVVGGERKQLIFQFLGESFVLCFISFITAILLVQLTLPTFNDLSNKALALSYLVDVKLISCYIILFIVTGFLAGFYPALILSNYNPVQTLYSRFMLAGKNYLQKSLVVLQFTLASFLIIATLTIISQFNFLTSKSLGYDDKNLLVIPNWGMTTDQVNLFRQQLSNNPDIAGVSSKDMGWDNSQVKVGGGGEVAFVRETVDENYIPLLKVPVVKGRNFSKDFPSDSLHSILVSETFVKQAGWKDPIGKEVTLSNGTEKFSVIGVVKDYYYQPLREVIKAQVFSLKPGRVLGNLYVKINPDRKAASLAKIESAFKMVFPNTAYAYYFKEEENLYSLATEARWKQILLFSAILTIFISSIGLFGLSVLSAEKRTKEIGIRKVLGASVPSVITILSKDFLKLIVIALLISIPFTWIAADKWLQNYPYRIHLGLGIFSLAAFIVVFVAMATVSFQAIKAATSNPVKSLRNE